MSDLNPLGCVGCFPIGLFGQGKQGEDSLFGTVLYFAFIIFLAAFVIRGCMNVPSVPLTPPMHECQHHEAERK